MHGLILVSRFQIHIHQIPGNAIFDVGSGDVFVKIAARDAEEAGKIFGMYLLHSGLLKGYAEQSKSCKILVRSPACEVRFNSWFTHHCMERDAQGIAVILECCFVKKVETFEKMYFARFTLY